MKNQNLDLITRNLQEIISLDELKELLNKKKEPVVYWGTMTTGNPHVAYFFPLLKLADFLKAGLKVKILIADLHAGLDGVDWNVLEKREKYYTALILEMIKILNVETKKLEFVKGSTFQLKPDYFNDLLKLSMIASVNDSTRAASEVVKMSVNPKLGNLIYPLMQALDEVYLDADIQFGGIDQRKILVFAREFLPKIGYKARVELMNPMIPGLVGEKMSSSVENSKISILDEPDTVNKKIKLAVCEEGNPQNGIMAFMKYFIMVRKSDREEKLLIKRSEKYGGNLLYENYEKLEKDFIEKKLHPQDLKNSLAEEINNLLKPLRENKKLKELHEKAY